MLATYAAIGKLRAAHGAMRRRPDFFGKRHPGVEPWSGVRRLNHARLSEVSSLRPPLAVKRQRVDWDRHGPLQGEFSFYHRDRWACQHNSENDRQERYLPGSIDQSNVYSTRVFGRLYGLFRSTFRSLRATQSGDKFLFRDSRDTAMSLDRLRRS